MADACGEALRVTPLFIAARVCDAFIGLAYFLIPMTIIYFVTREAVLVSFPGVERDKWLCKHVLLSVATFVLACGLTHLYRFTVLFFYNEPLTLVILALCAVVSVYTAGLLLLKTPRIIDIMAEVEVARRGHSVDLSKAFDIVSNWVPDMLSVHDTETLVFMHSNEMCSVFGYNQAMLYSMPLQDIVHVEDHMVLEALRTDCLAGQVSAYTFRVLAADRMYISVEAIPKKGRWNNTDSIFLLTRNVQTREERFHRATQAKEEQARITANRDHAMTLAHDLRTSLAIFELALNEIKMQPVFDVDAVASADSSLWFMKFIVTRTIDCCRVLQGERPRAFLESLDIPLEVRNTVQALSTYPQSLSVVCSFNLEDAASTFLCDREWLSSIVASFVCNALDNTMYGSVKLTVHNDAKMVRFEVADTGVGIHSHDAQRLFCPFTKLNNKLKPEHGLGIGLYNCAWRIRNLGGTYGFHPNEPHGSVFYFSLPLRKARAPDGGARRSSFAGGGIGSGMGAASAASGGHDDVFDGDMEAGTMVVPTSPSLSVPTSATAAEGASNRRSSIHSSRALFEDLLVLIVDDVLIFRKLLARQLVKRGVMHIDEATDGVHGLAMLQAKRYDVVICDEMMPLCKGSDCIKQYRQWESTTERFPPTAFILMSADVLRPDDDILTSGYIVDFLQKPLNMIRLMTILREIVTGAT